MACHDAFISDVLCLCEYLTKPFQFGKSTDFAISQLIEEISTAFDDKISTNREFM